MTTTNVTHDVNAVYAAELAYIVARRQALRDADVDASRLAGELGQGAGAIAPKVAHDTVGLALSGGGIRSAAFSLGVLQALAKLDALKYVDYLSTVSGGGYIGSCVTSLLTSNREAGVRPATSEVGPFPLGFTGADREAPEVRHLRDYSNYLAPHHGVFKLGTWRLVAAYLGALVLNLICPLSAIAFVFLFGTLAVAWLSANQWMDLSYLVWIAIVLGAIAALWLIALYLGARTKRARDLLTTGAAYAVAITMLPGFLVVAPGAYYELVGVILRSEPVSLGRFEESLRIFDLCKGSKGSECREVAGNLGTLRDALKLSGARVGSGETTVQRIADGLWDADVELEGRGFASEQTFEGSETAVIRGLEQAGVVVGETAPLTSWLNLSISVVGLVVPAAVLGYAKRSVRVFGFALVGFVAAVEVVHFAAWLYEHHPDALALWWPRFLVIAVVSGFAINVNKVSLLNFYRDRLADAYVIGRHPSGRIVTTDAIRLKDMLPSANGPYHILNATLNLSGSRDLSLRGRKSAHFLFSKFYCGSPRVSYGRTDVYARGQVDLATAMAISGAAVSPQSGAQTRPGLAVLMALLNLRLGQWLPNPAQRLKPGLVFWAYFFMKELFSLTDEDDWFVFVSDGGHFDNTGLYGLLQRRCRTIFVVDCGADPSRRFEDLANIIRKARIDFGIQIQLDLSKLHGDPQTRRAEAAFAVGTIIYPDKDRDPGGQGRIIFIKPTLSAAGNESEDLLEYARAHPTFPHETTADQFFNEAQFEAYRELGYQIMKDGFSKLGSGWFKSGSPTP